MDIQTIETMRTANGMLIITTVDADPPILGDLVAKANMGGYELTIAPKKHPRSLDANKMYWGILTKLANALNAPIPFMHNQMLRKYGQIATVDGNIMFAVLPDTEKVENEVDNSETIHLRPTSQVRDGKGGVKHRTYVVLRGSSTYDKAEFSALIDGLLSDCKEVGVDILDYKDKEQIKEYERWKTG